MPEESRRERHFDREAEKRTRRNFVLLVAAFAGLAMVGGVALALWIFAPPDEEAPTPIAKVEKEVKSDEGGFEPFERDEPDPVPERKPSGTLKRKLDPGDIDKGLARIRAALNACAVKHGAIDGTNVTVDFSVAPTGRVSEAYSRPPHKTPLGNCVAKVIRDKGKFRKTKEGLGDTRRTIKLRRTSG
jgi:hypothetical protein